jgi:hypothetical protein
MESNGCAITSDRSDALRAFRILWRRGPEKTKIDRGAVDLDIEHISAPRAANQYLSVFAALLAEPHFPREGGTGFRIGWRDHRIV